MVVHVFEALCVQVDDQTTSELSHAFRLVANDRGLLTFEDLFKDLLHLLGIT